MDSIIPALLAVGILLLASLMLGRSSFTSFSTMSDSWKSAEDRSIERLRSDINVDSISVSGSDIDVTILNDGATSLVDFSRMDIVVQYTSGGSNLIKYIDFTTTASPQPDDTWRVLSVNDDVIDPGIVNTSESMTIRIKLSPSVTAGDHWLQVTTELGISASSFFTT